MPNGKYAPSLVETAPVHIYEAMRTGPQQMPTFSKDVMTDQSVREIIGYLQEANDQPRHGGLGMGDAGPVSEGFWIFVLGIGGLSLIGSASKQRKRMRMLGTWWRRLSIRTINLPSSYQTTDCRAAMAWISLSP